MDTLRRPTKRNPIEVSFSRNSKDKALDCKPHKLPKTLFYQNYMFDHRKNDASSQGLVQPVLPPSDSIQTLISDFKPVP